MSGFVHLHCHSEYSLLDGLMRTKEMVKKAKEFGMPAVALTDHGVMYGTVEFYKNAEKEGIKPIVGCEIYVAPRSMLDKQASGGPAAYHLVLLVKNKKGYQNLCKLASIAALEGFYYTPRIDKEVLRQYSEGLIGLSACLKGEVQFNLNHREFAQAKEIAQEYQSIFAPGDFYLEMMDHGIPEQRKILPHLARLSQETGIKLIATNDVHYPNQKDAEAHDVLLCVQTGKTLDDPGRMKYSTDQFFFKSPDEMKKLFEEYPEAVANTLEVAEKCNLKLELGKNILPDYEVPEGFTKETYLEHLCNEGVMRRYGGFTPEIEERLKVELDVINGKGLSAYFLIVRDFIKYARDNKIPVGPGRGSAAGSILAYAIDITDVDPIKYGLIFERFLNPERISLPDIDTDFCQIRREEVIKYVTEKYGQDKVSQIVTFGRMKARAAIRDVGRVYGIPLNFVDKLAKLVPFGANLKEAIETPEMKELYDGDGQAKKLLDMAIQLEGLARNSSIHAAGVVISQVPITDCAPLYKMKNDEVVVQYDMNDSADIGLLKMDFLGLRNLTILDDAVNTIEKLHGIKLELLEIPLEDAATYDLLKQGKTAGVFQLESQGMTRYLTQLKPGNIEDIIAMCALYRPGPLKGGMVEDFIKRKHGLQETEYLHPVLEPILNQTYGVIVYQEQVMKIANEVAGYTMGEADELRRAMGKKKASLMAEQREIFMERAVKRGYDRDISAKIFDYMEAFASYGFNKSHTACYGLLAYWTAYLKVHYPQEYMAALMTSVMSVTEKVSFFYKECKSMDIPVLPPDVNESYGHFTVTGKGIRFGLAAIKNVGPGPIEDIIKARKAEGRFKDLHDFCCRVQSVNRKVLESLVYCGAMDSLGENRATMLQNLDTCLDFGSCRKKDKLSGQMSLFDDFEDEALAPPTLKRAEELEMKTLLSNEKALMGIYISDHPLNRYKELMDNDSVVHINELRTVEGGQKVIVAGIINSIKKKITKNNQTMAFIELEDLTDKVEITVFPRTYEEAGSLIVEDGIVIIKGKLELDEPFIKDDDEESEIELVPKILAEDIKELDKKNLPRRAKTLRRIEDKKSQKKFKGVHIKLENHGIDLQKLYQIIKNSPGEVPVYLNCESADKSCILLVSPSLFIHSFTKVKGEVESLLGGGSIWAEQ